MRHKVAGRKLGRSTDHRRALYRNLVTDLLSYEKITTTEAKAKEIRGMAERMITLGKTGGLHSRRQALAFIMDEKVVDKVFAELAPRYAERPGGYTRIVKLGSRLGDGAAMVKLELVG
jgi:large subunit ribosomal protein L17